MKAPFLWDVTLVQEKEGDCVSVAEILMMDGYAPRTDRTVLEPGEMQEVSFFVRRILPYRPTVTILTQQDRLCRIRLSLSRLRVAGALVLLLVFLALLPFLSASGFALGIAIGVVLLMAGIEIAAQWYCSREVLEMLKNYGWTEK